jgi:hypothetical protein
MSVIQYHKKQHKKSVKKFSNLHLPFFKVQKERKRLKVWLHFLSKLSFTCSVLKFERFFNQRKWDSLPRPTKVRIWIEIHFSQRRNCSTKVSENLWTVETHFVNQGTFQKSLKRRKTRLKKLSQVSFSKYKN